MAEEEHCINIPQDETQYKFEEKRDDFLKQNSFYKYLEEEFNKDNDLNNYIDSIDIALKKLQNEYFIRNQLRIKLYNEINKTNDNSSFEREYNIVSSFIEKSDIYNLERFKDKIHKLKNSKDIFKDPDTKHLPKALMKEFEKSAHKDISKSIIEAEKSITDTNDIKKKEYILKGLYIKILAYQIANCRLFNYFGSNEEEALPQLEYMINNWKDLASKLNFNFNTSYKYLYLNLFNSFIPIFNIMDFKPFPYYEELPSYKYKSFIDILIDIPFYYFIHQKEDLVIFRLCDYVKAKMKTSKEQLDQEERYTTLSLLSNRFDAVKQRYELRLPYYIEHNKYSKQLYYMVNDKKIQLYKEGIYDYHIKEAINLKNKRDLYDDSPDDYYYKFNNELKDYVSFNINALIYCIDNTSQDNSLNTAMMSEIIAHLIIQYEISKPLLLTKWHFNKEYKCGEMYINENIKAMEYIMRVWQYVINKIKNKKLLTEYCYNFTPVAPESSFSFTKPLVSCEYFGKVMSYALNMCIAIKSEFGIKSYSRISSENNEQLSFIYEYFLDFFNKNELGNNPLIEDVYFNHMEHFMLEDEKCLDTIYYGSMENVKDLNRKYSKDFEYIKEKYNKQKDEIKTKYSSKMFLFVILFTIPLITYGVFVYLKKYYYSLNIKNSNNKISVGGHKKIK